MLTTYIQVLVKAAQNGLETTSLRVGQVCGGKTTGAWSTTEWVAILTKSSLSIGAFPDLDGVRPLLSRALPHAHGLLPP